MANLYDRHQAGRFVGGHSEARTPKSHPIAAVVQSMSHPCFPFLCRLITQPHLLVHFIVNYTRPLALSDLPADFGLLH